MVVLLFACWCMAVPKSFVALLVFKSLCGVANTNYIFTHLLQIELCKVKSGTQKISSVAVVALSKIVAVVACIRVVSVFVRNVAAAVASIRIAPVVVRKIAAAGVAFIR
jgi:hypothetical protein